MKKYTKKFIRKEIQNPNINIVKVTLKVAEIEKFKNEYNGEEYISFELAKLKIPTSLAEHALLMFQQKKKLKY